MKITNKKTRKLLLAVKRQILKEPRQLIMGAVLSPRNELGNQPPNCGTAACIAGWAYCIAYGTKPSEAYRGISIHDYQSVGSQLLEIKFIQAERLFNLGLWPVLMCDAHRDSKTMIGKARIAAKRIDHFLATGE